MARKVNVLAHSGVKVLEKKTLNFREWVCRNFRNDWEALQGFPEMKMVGHINFIIICSVKLFFFYYTYFIRNYLG